MEISTDRGIYQEYYSKCFRANPKSIPSQFILVKDIGFADGYRRTENTWMLRHAGVLPDQRGKGYSNLLGQVAQALKGAGYTYIMCDVENTNTPALHATLALGFQIIGFRTSTDGVGYVEMITRI